MALAREPTKSSELLRIHLPKLFGNSELIPNRGYEAAKRGQRSPDRLPLGAKEECSRHLLLFSKQFLRDCLKIPDKPHCGLSRVLRTQPGTPFHRLACHQTQRLRTPLAIFQTVSKRTSENTSSRYLDEQGQKEGPEHITLALSFRVLRFFLVARHRPPGRR